MKKLAVELEVVNLSILTMMKNSSEDQRGTITKLK